MIAVEDALLVCADSQVIEYEEAYYIPEEARGQAFVVAYLCSMIAVEDALLVYADSQVIEYRRTTSRNTL